MAMALWLKLLLRIVVALLVIGTGTIAYGAWRWQRGTLTLRAQLQGARCRSRPLRMTHARLRACPPRATLLLYRAAG